MRSGDDPAIPARIGRLRNGPDLVRPATKIVPSAAVRQSAHFHRIAGLAAPHFSAVARVRAASLLRHPA
jgi:hypothetical protein